MIAFATAQILMLVIPGPGVLSAAAIGASFGLKDGARYLTGLWAGNFIVSLIVVSGLWALLVSVSHLRLILSVASLLYFAYLAIKIARANPRIGFGEIQDAPGFIDGLVLQLLNPKAYAANVFLFSNFAMFPGELVLEVTVKILMSNAIWIPMHLAWLQLGLVVKKLDLQPEIQRRINMAMAGSLMVVVMLAAVGLY